MTSPAKINYKLLELLSPNWAKKFKKRLTPQDYEILVAEAKCCIVGCFHEYNDGYTNRTNVAEYCPTCSDLADWLGVGGVLNRRLSRDKRYRYHPTAFRKVVEDYKSFDKDDPLRKLDREGIVALNEVLNEFYKHVKEKHPERLIAKMEAAIFQ